MHLILALFEREREREREREILKLQTIKNIYIDQKCV